jgi:hypothetical protein
MVIDVPADQPFILSGKIDSPLPKVARDPNFDIDTQFFEEHATFTVPIQVKETKEGTRTLSVDVVYQTCNDTLCLPPTKEELKLAVLIGNEKFALPPPPGTDSPAIQCVTAFETFGASSRHGGDIDGSTYSFRIHRPGDADGCVFSAHSLRYSRWCRSP